MTLPRTIIEGLGLSAPEARLVEQAENIGRPDGANVAAQMYAAHQMREAAADISTSLAGLRHALQESTVHIIRSNSELEKADRSHARALVVLTAALVLVGVLGIFMNRERTVVVREPTPVVGPQR